MAVVEARSPGGKLLELTEVTLTTSGFFVIITDASGNQSLIHRYAWPKLVEEVEKLFEHEKQRAIEHIARAVDLDD